MVNLFIGEPTGVRSASAFHYERSHRNRLGNRCCNSSLPDTSRVIRNYSPTSYIHIYIYTQFGDIASQFLQNVNNIPLSKRVSPSLDDTYLYKVIHVIATQRVQSFSHKYVSDKY